MKPSKLKLKPSINFEALGTRWFIESDLGISIKREREIQETLERIDRVWSRFRDDSLVTRMSQHKGMYSLEKDDRRLIEWYESLYAATNGSVTPLIGQTLSDAGYDATYRLIPKESIAKTPPWNEVINRTAAGIQMIRPAILDVGAAGKGFAIDAVANLFGNEQYTIDAGGDIRIQGTLQSIGLEHPTVSGELIGTVAISNGSICGSAGNRRIWEGWHHIINPVTSRPVEDIIATWVMADTAMYADGIASALFFTPPEELKALSDFLYVIMYENGSVYHSKSNDIQLFT